MSKNTINLILMIGGALLALVSLLADVIGIGSYPGINYAQIGGAVVGVLFILLGFLRYRRMGKE